MLQRVSIQNFKSLKDVTLDLQKVNLLIGPNNSGKTNFLKALEFAKSLTEPISDTEVIDAFRMGSDPSVLKIEFKFVENFFVKTINTLKFSAVREFFPVRTVQINLTYKSLDQESENKVVSAFSSRLDEVFFNSVRKRETEPEQDTIIQNTINSFLYIRNYIFRNINVYSPNPTSIVIPRPLFAEDFIDKDCSNLISFLNTFSNNYKNEFRALEKDFSKCVEEFIELSTPPINTTEGGKLSLKFFDKYGNSFWGKDVSEGVLYFLALLCIVHQPNPPRLLLLEEPERGIHPRRIHEVMNFIFQLAEEKDVQIILTSHNENVLNYFSNHPESVFVFDKNEEGATQVRNLKRDIIEPSHRRSRENELPEIDFTSELGDNWMYGILGGVPEDAL